MLLLHLIHCRLNIQLADADTSQQPAAIRLLQALASLAITFPNVTHLSFSQYVEPTSLADVGSYAPVPHQLVQLKMLRQIAAAVLGMLQHVEQQQQQAVAAGELHVAVDPAQLLLHAMLHQQELAVGLAGQQQQQQDQQEQQQQQQLEQHLQQQQLEQQPHTIDSTGGTPALPPGSSNTSSSSSSSSSSEGCVLWGNLREVDGCPADPFVLAFLLAVAPGIQKLRFRSQQCRYYEVAAGVTSAASSSGGSSSRKHDDTAADSRSLYSSSSEAAEGRGSSGQADSRAAVAATMPTQTNRPDRSSSSSLSNSASEGILNTNTGSSLTRSLQQQQSSNLWFDFHDNAAVLSSCSSSSCCPNHGACKTAAQSTAAAAAAVYSPWCLLQCVQLLQHYGLQVGLNHYSCCCNKVFAKPTVLLASTSWQSSRIDQHAQYGVLSINHS
jgi:hypothetical protein